MFSGPPAPGLGLSPSFRAGGRPCSAGGTAPPSRLISDGTCRPVARPVCREACPAQRAELPRPLRAESYCPVAAGPAMRLASFKWRRRNTCWSCCRAWRNAPGFASQAGRHWRLGSARGRAPTNSRRAASLSCSRTRWRGNILRVLGFNLLFQLGSDWKHLSSRVQSLVARLWLSPLAAQHWKAPW